MCFFELMYSVFGQTVAPQEGARARECRTAARHFLACGASLRRDRK